MELTKEDYEEVENLIVDKLKKNPSIINGLITEALVDNQEYPDEYLKLNGKISTKIVFKRDNKKVVLNSIFFEDVEFSRCGWKALPKVQPIVDKAIKIHEEKMEQEKSSVLSRFRRSLKNLPEPQTGSVSVIEENKKSGLLSVFKVGK